MTDKQAFETFARQTLNETIEHLDHTTATQLSVMRHEAIASTTDRQQNWFMLAALGTAMAAFMLIWMIPEQDNHKSELAMQMDIQMVMQMNIQEGMMEDIDLLASDIELELLEDVEFYQWLEGSKHAG